MEIMPFKFIHCADLHLDSPFEGIHDYNPDIAKSLRNATFESFQNIIDLAIDENVDFIIIAGDIFDGANRNIRAQYRFNQILKHAVDSGIQCFLAHGNHDPLSSWESSLKLPDNVHRFDCNSVGKVVVKRNNEILANIYGISYRQKEVKTNLVYQFPQKNDNDPFSIGVLHCNVGGISEHDNYAPCTIDDLVKCGLDYWALGHVHNQIKLRESHPYIIYPGNSQGRNIRETGEKGCFLVQVDDDKNVDINFVPTDKIRWFVKEINISIMDNTEEVVDSLMKEKEYLRSISDGRSSVVRFYLNGRTELNKKIRNEESEIIQILREDENEREQFSWVESILINTRPPIDISSRKQVDDFIGEFLRLSESLKTSDYLRSEILRILTSIPEHSLIAKQLESLTEDDLLSILDDAESLGLDWLIEEGD
ncbi:TPA: DNA repair exonuclease [Candidatus Poribacteria bacterium]|nr:DNA repair exonuclease [Candidatus Poribacteria bacterium]